MHQLDLSAPLWPDCQLCPVPDSMEPELPKGLPMVDHYHRQPPGEKGHEEGHEGHEGLEGHEATAGHEGHEANEGDEGHEATAGHEGNESHQVSGEASLLFQEKKRQCISHSIKKTYIIICF